MRRGEIVRIACVIMRVAVAAKVVSVKGRQAVKIQVNFEKGGKKCYWATRKKPDSNSSRSHFHLFTKQELYFFELHRANKTAELFVTCSKPLRSPPGCKTFVL